MNNFHEIKPDVPEVIREDATPIEKYLLDRSSVSEQQNEFLHVQLEKILAQTTATNGRVTALEKEAKETRVVVGTVKKVRSWLIGSVTIAMPVVYLVAQKILEGIWK